MFIQIIFLTLLLATAKCHTPVNSSDVIIVGGHADINDDAVFFTNPRSSVTEKTRASTFASDSDGEYMVVKSDPDHDARKNGGIKDDHKDEVLFVPTDRNIFRNDDTVHEDTIRMADVLENNRRIGGLMKETEAPAGDILFIQGKNNEKQSIPYESRRNDDDGNSFRYLDDGHQTTITTPVPLDCTNLDCENEIASICGQKTERSITKYRLFKNECFFRKVNCGFNYEMNRYQQVDLEHCKTVATHVKQQESLNYFPKPQPQYPLYSRREEKERKEVKQSRRFDGRRAMAINLGGSYCSHPCPSVCPEAYEPECAISSAGERRTFQNHCKLDLVSCQTNTVWRRRPLAECTGGMKADMHQNRAFIDWMQRVGIVDKKGKLVLNK